MNKMRAEQFMIDSMKENYGDDFYDILTALCEEFEKVTDVSGIDDIVMFGLVTDCARKRRNIEDFEKVGKKGISELGRLVEAYRSRVRKEWEELHKLWPEHAGKWNEDKFWPEYDDEYFAAYTGNTSKVDLESWQLALEVMDIPYEIRVATGITEDLVTSCVMLAFPKEETGIVNVFWRGFEAYRQEYERRLIEAGYPVKELRAENPEKWFFFEYRCEERFFPELFKQKGSKYIMSREEIKEYFEASVKEKDLDMYCEVDFKRKCIVVGKGALEKYRERGYRYTWDDIELLALSAEFFNEEPELMYKDPDTGKERYIFKLENET